MHFHFSRPYYSDRQRHSPHEAQRMSLPDIAPPDLLILMESAGQCHTAAERITAAALRLIRARRLMRCIDDDCNTPLPPIRRAVYRHAGQRR